MTTIFEINARAKYKTVKWNELCTEDEWTIFMELIRKKDKIEELRETE